MLEANSTTTAQCETQSGWSRVIPTSKYAILDTRQEEIERENLGNDSVRTMYDTDVLVGDLGVMAQYSV
jgi:hypothetical protein